MKSNNRTHNLLLLTVISQLVIYSKAPTSTPMPSPAPSPSPLPQKQPQKTQLRVLLLSLLLQLQLQLLLLLLVVLLLTFELVLLVISQSYATSACSPQLNTITNYALLKHKRFSLEYFLVLVRSCTRILNKRTTLFIIIIIIIYIYIIALALLHCSPAFDCCYIKQWWMS